MIRSQRDAATALVIGAISISVLLASIPALPMLGAPSIYTVLFGVVLIALAIVSEGIAAFAAFKFFDMLERLLTGRKDAIIRMVIAAAVGTVALVGNGALVKIGLQTANANLVTLEDVMVDRAERQTAEAQQLRASVIEIQRGDAGAVATVFMPQGEAATTVAQQDETNVRRMTQRADRLERQAEADRVSAATVTDRPEYLIMLAILVLKFAEVTLVFLASPLARRDLQGAAIAGRRLTNEERIAMGMKPLGRPKLHAVK